MGTESRRIRGSGPVRWPVRGPAEPSAHRRARVLLWLRSRGCRRPRPPHPPGRRAGPSGAAGVGGSGDLAGAARRVPPSWPTKSSGMPPGLQPDLPGSGRLARRAWNAACSIRSPTVAALTPWIDVIPCRVPVDGEEGCKAHHATGRPLRVGPGHSIVTAPRPWSIASGAGSYSRVEPSGPWPAALAVAEFALPSQPKRLSALRSNSAGSRQLLDGRPLRRPRLDTMKGMA